MYTNFEFDGHRLSDFGCIVANINSNNGYREMDIGSKISFNTVKNNQSSKHYVTSSKYDSNYSVTLQIVKDIPRNNYNNVYFNQFEIRELMKWLNRRGYYKFKPIYKNIEDCDIHYYGSFNVEELKINNKTIGLAITFNSNAPFAFGEKIEFTLVTSQLNEHISIWGESDEFTTIYPDVKIKCLSEGNDNVIKIVNMSSDDEDDYIEILGCQQNETITLCGEHGLIYSDIRTDEEISDKFNYNFFNINVMKYYDENEYEVSIPCEITISYEPIRKVGGY